MVDEVKNSTKSSTLNWINIVGALIGIFTILFLMALILIPIINPKYVVAFENRFLVVAVLAFGVAFASSFIGGTAAASGKIPLPIALSHPIEFSAAGGIVVFVLVMVLGDKFYISIPQPPPHIEPKVEMPLLSGHVILFDGWNRYSQSGFDFSSHKIVSWDSGKADVLVSNTKPPVPLVKLFVQYEEPPFTSSPQDEHAQGGIIQMNETHLDDVDECPTEDYSVHWFDVYPDRIYCLRTRDGQHYAKIKVKKVYADRIAFDWVFQPKRSSKFD